MAPPNENRPAGRQTGKATNFNSQRVRVYDASNPETSPRADLQGRLWVGNLYVGNEKSEERNKTVFLAAIRLHEIGVLVDYRRSVWGQLPDLAEVLQAAYALNRLCKGPYIPALTEWCTRYAPEALAADGTLYSDIVEPIVDVLLDREEISRAPDCGRALELTVEERRHLDIRTIAVEGTTKEQRKAAKRARDRAHKEAKRRKAGVKPRAVFEAEAMARMIEASGKSRASHYRDLKRETGVSLIGMRSIPRMAPHLSHIDAKEADQ